MSRRKAGLSTRAIHGPPRPRRNRDPVTFPIFQSSTFINPIGSADEVLYTRYGNNPNQVELARRLSALEGAEAAIFLASGMGATALAHLALLNPGDHLVSSEWIYGATRRLFDREYTPTELMRAHRSGAPLQKLFPAPASVPQFIGSVLGPLPFLRIVPTNGVDANNAAACLEAGAFAVGFTTALFDADDIAQHRFERIEERARGLLAALGTRPPAGTLIAGTPGAQRDGTGRTP